VRTLLYAQVIEPIERAVLLAATRIHADVLAGGLLDRFLGVKSAAACGIYCSMGQCYPHNQGCTTDYYWYCYNHCTGTQGWMCLSPSYGCPYNGLCFSQC
jgi:hypothetical protein